MSSTSPLSPKHLEEKDGQFECLHAMVSAGKWGCLAPKIDTAWDRKTIGIAGRTNWVNFHVGDAISPSTIIGEERRERT